MCEPDQCRPRYRRVGQGARKMTCIVDRRSTARNAVKLAQTAYTCLLLPTRSSGYGGHGADKSSLRRLRKLVCDARLWLPFWVHSSGTRFSRGQKGVKAHG